MDIDAVITGDRRVVARFDEWPKDFHDALLARIRDLTSELQSRVRALAPSRTDKLKDEIISRVFDDPQKIKGLVTLEDGLSGSEYAKAGALEYGAHRATRVRKHRRTITEAFGRTISPTSADIQAYSRIANIDAQIFLRGGLGDVEGDAVTQLQEVIDQSSKEFGDDA